jgi:DNA polymerase III delta subunit
MPIYFVVARDPLIAAEGVAARLPDGMAVERQHVADLDLDAIFAQLGIPDLFATARAVHYIDFLALKLPGKKDAERLAGILTRLPEELTLVCSQVLDYPTRGEEHKALNSQSYKRWVGDAPVDDLRSQSEGQRAIAWLRQRARQRYQLALGDAQLRQLLAANDNRPALVDGELSKLWMMADDDGQLHQVTDELLERAMSTSPGAQFYELVDAILAGSRDAQRRLECWHFIEPEAFHLLAELRRRLLALLALSRNERVQPPYLAQQLRPVARRWPAPRLRRAITRLAELEYALKSGATVGSSSRAAELSALQLYVADVSGPA